MVKKDNSGGNNEYNGYCKAVEVPSEDEMMALNAMRGIKARVRDLKRKLSQMSVAGEDEKSEEILALEEQMVRLKTEWNEWEERRRNAARERMILLGHEER